MRKLKWIFSKQIEIAVFALFIVSLIVALVLGPGHVALGQLIVFAVGMVLIAYTLADAAYDMYPKFRRFLRFRRFRVFRGGKGGAA